LGIDEGRPGLGEVIGEDHPEAHGQEGGVGGEPDLFILNFRRKV